MPLNWFVYSLTRYAQFAGRSCRAEYWWFQVFVIVLMFVGGMIEGLAGVKWVGVTLVLALVVPSFAVTVRRLHDINKSGWWLLIGMIPIVGLIILSVMCALAGTEDRNDYGGDPKRVEIPEVV